MYSRNFQEDRSPCDRCVRHADFYARFLPVSYATLNIRVGGSSIVGSYRDDTGTIASSFDDPIGCYFMASSAT